MLHNSWINSLLYTSEGKLYIGTYDGLGCVDIKTMDFISPLKNRRILYGDVIYALHEGSDGSIWIGTSKGLKHLNPKSLDIREYRRWFAEQLYMCNQGRYEWISLDQYELWNQSVQPPKPKFH